MKSKWILRIAAVLVVVHLLGHIMGHLGWDKPADPKMQEVVNSMKSYKSNFMGATKSMADYYHGYSLLLIVVYAMTGLIFWIASTEIESERRVLVKILIPIALGYLAFGIIEYNYFFPFAASMSFLAGLLALTGITIVKQ